MMTITAPEAGKLYQCVLAHGTTRLCRYGYHRKNIDRNWGLPPTGMRPTCVWFGWRDNDNFRFVREEEVVSFTEVSDIDRGHLSPAIDAMNTVQPTA